MLRAPMVNRIKARVETPSPSPFSVLVRTFLVDRKRNTLIQNANKRGEDAIARHRYLMESKNRKQNNHRSSLVKCDSDQRLDDHTTKLARAGSDLLK